MPLQLPTTHSYLFPYTGRTMLMLGSTAMSELESWNRSPLANQLHGTTGWSGTRLHWRTSYMVPQDSLEPVSNGKLVTWCHRMVWNPSPLANQVHGATGWTSVKNAKPRSTTNFQPLNTHAARKTPHTNHHSNMLTLYHTAKRKDFLMPGTATMVFPYTKTIGTTLPHYPMRPIHIPYSPTIVSGNRFPRRYNEILSTFN